MVIEPGSAWVWGECEPFHPIVSDIQVGYTCKVRCSSVPLVHNINTRNKSLFPTACGIYHHRHAETKQRWAGVPKTDVGNVDPRLALRYDPRSCRMFRLWTAVKCSLYTVYHQNVPKFLLPTVFGEARTPVGARSGQMASLFWLCVLNTVINTKTYLVNKGYLLPCIR